jgi:hypothetical protein
MTRRLSDKTLARRAMAIAAELGQPLRALTLPSGMKLEFSVAETPIVVLPSEDDEAVRRVEAAFQGRRRAAA